MVTFWGGGGGGKLGGGEYLNCGDKDAGTFRAILENKKNGGGG